VSAALAPDEAPARREVVTRVRAEEARSNVVQPVELIEPVSGGKAIVTAVGAAPPTREPAAAAKRDGVEPLTAELRRLHVTVSSRILEKLEAARTALSHSHPAASGGVCGSTLRVELDHIQPRALGGLSTISNIRVLCRVHNDLAARRVFGEEWMDRFTRPAGNSGDLELSFVAPQAAPNGVSPALPGT
jgi:hypothetical protein